MCGYTENRIFKKSRYKYLFYEKINISIIVSDFI